MIVLHSTDKLQVITPEGCDLDVSVSYVDRDTTTYVTGTAAPQYTNIASATTTDILAAPASGKVRTVKSIHIKNSHATTWATPKVLVDVSGTDYELQAATLRPGDTLQYTDTYGFRVLLGTALPLNRTFMVNEDFINQSANGAGASVVGAHLGGLSCPLPRAEAYYCFKAHIIHVSSGTTNGALFGFNVTGNDTDPSVIGAIDTVTTNVNGSTHSAASINSRNTIITSQTTGSANQCLAIIAGATRPTTANGIFVILAAPEADATNGLTVKAGSWLHIFEPTN